MFTISYTISNELEGEKTYYLNHSCLNTLSFGSRDMAWTTDDHEKAQLMLFKVHTVHSEDSAEITLYQ